MQFGRRSGASTPAAGVSRALSRGRGAPVASPDAFAPHRVRTTRRTFPTSALGAHVAKTCNLRLSLRPRLWHRRLSGAELRAHADRPRRRRDGTAADPAAPAHLLWPSAKEATLSDYASP